jgi:cytochrome c oxidase assembly factor CtaG/putative copper export protein
VTGTRGPTTARRNGNGSAVSGPELWRWAAGAALVTVSVLVVVLLAGGGAPQPVPAGLPDAGALTGWGLPVVRLFADLAGLATVGLLLAAGLLLSSPEATLGDAAARAAALAGRVAAGWLLAVLVEIVLTVSDIFGVPPGQAADATVLRSFLGQTSQGRALLVQLALVIVVGGLARAAVSPRGAVLALVVALGALAPPALTGHSASAGSDELAVASLLVHLLAAALWVGGLAALAWVAVGEASRSMAGQGGLRLAVPRFSTLAGWCFAAIAISGVVNAAVRLGGFGPLLSSAYGVLVLGKVTAIAVLGGFGWWHRRRSVTALASAGGPGSAPGPVRAFLSVAAAELVVMAATVALAVGLSRTPTPVRRETHTSPAAQLLGFPLPGPPTAARLLFGWVPDGFALTFLALAAGIYAAGVLALRRRGDRWPAGRSIAWAVGLLVFAWATVGGLGLYSHVLFSAHMVAHMLLSMVAPIGLVLGAPITLALRALPGPRVRGEASSRGLLTAALRSRAAGLLTNPLLAFALFVGSLYGLYFTGLFPALMGNHLGHVAMEFHFLAVGSLFFWVLVGIDPTPHRLPPIARIGLLFVAMPFHAFFSIALMSGVTVLAPAYYRRLDRPYWTDLLADQHLGGGIGWAMGELPILLVLGAVFVQWARSDARDASRFDRAADRAGDRTANGSSDIDDELTRYNARLAALHARSTASDRAVPDNAEGPQT